MANRRVDPIREKKKIVAIKNYLKREDKFRDYCLFACGINFGLRISDLLQIQVRDVRNSLFEIKDTFEIREQKTGKFNVIAINNKAKEAIDYLFSNTNVSNNLNNYLFYNTLKKDGKTKITIVHANNLVKKWCRNVGLTNIKVGNHTLRKTFGYHAWKNGVSIEVLQKKFKHTSISTTRLYLGIEEKEVVKSYHKLDL